MHTDISSEDVLNLLLLETTLDNQTSSTVDTSAGTQFGEQELHNVVVRTLHTLADIGDVGENGTTVTFTQTLRRRDLVRLGPAGEHVGVVALDEGKETVDEERVRDSLRRFVGPDTGASFKVALGDLVRLLLRALLRDISLGQLGFEIARVGLLGSPLLLFLQRGRVELAVGSGCGFIALAFFLGLLRRLLLLGQSLEHLGDFVDLLVCAYTDSDDH